MLALSRGEGQSIIIDGHIEIKIVKWSRSSVRLAIQAPREITVDRDEIWRKMNPGKPTPLEQAELDRGPRTFPPASHGVVPEGPHGAGPGPGGVPPAPEVPPAAGSPPPPPKTL